MRAWAVTAALLLALTACLAGTSPQVVKPAPTTCPALERGHRFPADELSTRFRGHVPRTLPAGFGFASAYESITAISGTARGPRARWVDAFCREISLIFYPSTQDQPLTGTPFGSWRVEFQNPGPCDPTTVCVAYHTNVAGGYLRVQTFGLDRSVADPVVSSIPM